MKHITKTIIILQLIIIIALCISIPRYYRQLDLLENRNKQLELQLEITVMELKNTQLELTGTYQQLEQVTIKFLADEVFIEDLQGRYLRLYSYANMAESILLANDIEFYKTESIGGK